MTSTTKASKVLAQNKKVKISTSDLYVIMGLNYFHKFDKVLLSVWKSYDYKDYKDFETTYKNTHNIIPSTMSGKSQIAALTARHKFDVGNITNTSKASNAKDMLSGQKDILSNINKNVKRETKKELTTIIKRGLNTKVKNEDKEKIKELENKYNIKIQEKIDASKNKSKKEKEESQKKIIEQIDKVIKEDKERLNKLVKTHTNTRFGIFQEDSAIKIFEEEKGKKISGQQKRFEYHINTLDDYRNSEVKIDWFLVGKLDGYTEDYEVLEIKNRVNRLFGTIPRYEYPQLMTYMKMAGSQKGYMLEQYKGKDGKQEHGIYEVNYTNNYFDALVLPAIYKFQNYFSDFVKCDKMKGQLICGQEKELYDNFMNNY